MRAAALVFAGCVLALTGCGSAERDSEGAAPPSGSLEALWRKPGEDVAIVPGTSDYAPGTVRLSFLVVGKNGRPVFRPKARLWLATGLKAKPFGETTARLVSIGVPGGYRAHESRLYVARFRLPAARTYWVLAEPVGGKPIQAVGTLPVKKQTASPAVGARAFPSRTPTLRTAGGDLRKLTTRVPPDRELLRYSIAESLAARKPFVVVFATPKFCKSRTCGPVVDVVDHARRRFAGTDVRFIHVEIYEDNDPAKGLNRFVREWRLPTEPWVFLVGRDGRIKEKFEGSVSLGELSAAVDRTLRR